MRARTRLVIGTACSGTDSCIKSLEHLGSVTGWSFHHAFSCEATPGKQDWIRENFPGLPQLFPDVKKLHTGECLNVITGRHEPVPAVDLFLAGFVCKAVSTMNNDRHSYGACVEHGIGETGDTFSGVRQYVERFRPKMVMCENVIRSIWRERSKWEKNK